MANSEPGHPDLELRLAFLGLERDEVEALRVLLPTVEARADDFVARFYRHLLGFAETRDLLADPLVRDRLLSAQRVYLLSLVDAPLDEEYVQGRREIGLTHVRVGLAPTFYLGAYALYTEEVGEAVQEHYRGDSESAERAFSTLRKRILLDAQIAMESYIGSREAQLDFANEELARAQRVLERDFGVQRQELRETTARARAAEQLASVGTLAAGLAHEIGTPMGVIRGHAELLEDRVKDEKGLWRVRTIIEQIDRISNVMQGLLDLARPREPVLVPLELEAVIETALSFLGEKLERRGVKVERVFDGSLPIRGDGQKLQQLFLNLFLNAADAMAKGGQLTVTVAADPEAKEVEVRVRDTGNGIAESELPRIFDPFFTSKEAGRGNGLGLVVAQGIVLDHGGDIEVDSAPGRGTEFRITFPAITEAPEGPAAA